MTPKPPHHDASSNQWIQFVDAFQALSDTEQDQLREFMTPEQLDRLQMTLDQISPPEEEPVTLEMIYQNQQNILKRVTKINKRVGCLYDAFIVLVVIAGLSLLSYYL